MEIKFKDKLQYQADAINSVVNLFEGQSILSSNVSIMSEDVIDDQILITPIEGKGNIFNLSPQDIEENLLKVQAENGLPLNEKLESYDFTVEMETGTGKTYVYLRTILELNIHYGFSKFVIVVPSLAIKEGVKKTIDITREHFAKLYNNINYNDFIFDSSNMKDLETFMEDDNIQIMIITIHAFNKEKNKINQITEKGIIPMNYITRTRPIVIIDEPQSVLGGKSGKGKEAVKTLNPLFTLQYSATPKDAENIVYQLNAVDAYNKNLVKKIEVNAFIEADYQGKPFIKLNKTKMNNKGKRTADITLVKKSSTGLNTIVKKC
ncbi:DEAD/DEAH box helicase family protein [uncultured Methanobrevibacter sp.]|uniref:DEAD/DEAH box helicase family protein n=1 Tax=uncultured Methanobrevibacter sp. TaxID=253161 RepID=UPI0025D3985E|nr:DEAD/DEAH box helicase family protein [uncultured Methanobrevibacter sp.]